VTGTITGLEIAHRIEQEFPDSVEEAIPEAATIKREKLTDVCRFLRDNPELKFEFLSSLTGVDRLEYFDVVYHLTSIRINQITAIKVRADRENPRVPSVTPIWPGVPVGRVRRVAAAEGLSDRPGRPLSGARALPRRVT
jgi:NADH-quinone oxidoreductase subunit C